MNNVMTENTIPQILVLDDEQDFGDFISEVAKSLNYQCKAVSSASDFKTLLHADVQLIFLDLVMPNLDGVEILRYLKSNNCCCKLILMSGFNKRVLEVAEDLAKELELSVIGHIEKPIRKADLEKVLHSAMEQTINKSSKNVEATKQVVVDITETLIQQALDNHEFLVYYQPQIEIEDNHLIGMEVLIRWQHPIYGFIMPDSFIATAESLGMIDKLSWYVIEQAFKEMTAFIASNPKSPTLSLNVSAATLINLNFPDQLLELSKKYSIPPEKITIEITESGLFKDLASALDILTRLRMKMINLSIDDFGTGYAMMKQLRHVPANELKIDKSFVQEVNVQESARVMVLKIIEMGHALDMKVVAEGVETTDQFTFMKDNHCDIIQGYYYSRPLPYQDIMNWIKDFNK